MLLEEMSWPEVAAVAHDLPVVDPDRGRRAAWTASARIYRQHAAGRSGPARGRAAGRTALSGLRSCGWAIRTITSILPERSRRHRALISTFCGDLIDNLVTHGFRRVVLLNGHGGNIVPAQQAVFEARQRYRERDDLLLLAATYWLLGGKPDQVDPTIVQRQMGHACEWETSMILHLAPNLVGPL